MRKKEEKSEESTILSVIRLIKKKKGSIKLRMR